MADSLPNVPQGYTNPAFVANGSIEVPKTDTVVSDKPKVVIRSKEKVTFEEDGDKQGSDEDVFIGDEFKFKDKKPPLANCEKCFRASSKAIKLIVSIILNLALLGCLVVSKGCLLFITTQLHPSVTFIHATNNASGKDTCDVRTTCIYSNETTDPTEINCQENDNVRWLWALFITQCTPYFLMFLACIWQMCFKLDDAPDWKTFLVAIAIETLQSIGIFILLYVILPFIDVFRGLFLFTAVAIVPTFLQMFHGFEAKKPGFLIADLLAFVAQFSALIVWPIAYAISNRFGSIMDLCDAVVTGVTGMHYAHEYDSIAIDGTVPEFNVAIGLIPLALILCSVTWWENFVDEDTQFGRFTKAILKLRKRYMSNKIKPKMYALLSLYKIVITFAMLLIYFSSASFYGENIANLFDASNFYETRCNPLDSESQGVFLSDWLIVAFIQVGVGLFAFYASAFAIMAHMQLVSFTIPLLSATPVALGLLIWACEGCHNAWDLSTDYFWNCFQGYDDLGSSFSALVTYVGIIWWISQLWSVRYLLFPRIERLAKMDKIFTRPMHCGVLLEQSLMFIRRRNDEEDITVSKEHREDQITVAQTQQANIVANPLFNKDKTTPYVYMCATMWHEEKREMVQLLVSILRTDFDVWLMKKINDPDMYEFELNIYFDDAFAKAKDGSYHTLNKWVMQFLNAFEEAKRSYFENEWRGKPPKHEKKPIKYATPYGGQIVIYLPFDSKMIIHLKDKRKIRNRKRWSQVMYMFSLVGQQIEGQRQYDKALRAQVADNSYVLALDGDVDFQPEALTLLLDLMKRDKQVAAACGRIHPIGSGPMVWYQKFEYSLSHWLQKSTEHVLGCVLCSPGCFSLFRCSKIEDVMARYSHLPENARQHVQFDQGEDRWLCTLLLQQGHRIEYSAASDAYTYAPEAFKEFYNQRRRWITSTYANVMDLLADGRYTAKTNDNISMLYIMYQALLFGSSILGPATIFLLIVGAFDAVFQIGLGLAILCGLVPLAAFLVVCYKCKEDTQINFAAILSAIFAVLQTFVLIGLLRQMITDGICSPQSFFFLSVLGIFVLAAILHPQEGFNLVYIPIYFLLVPCMYMVLIIYSLCNVKSTSWGTREEKKVDPNKDAQKAEASKSAPGWMKYLGMDSFSGKAGYTMRCGTCCTLTCCGTPMDGNVEVMKELQDAKEEIIKVYQEDRTQRLHDKEIGRSSAKRDKQQSEQNDEHLKDVKVEETKENEKTEEDEMNSTEWLNHPHVAKWEHGGDIGTAEERFWTQLIDKYLKPLNADKTKAEVEKATEDLGEELAELRDKVVFGFFLIDILLIVTIMGMSLTIEQVPEMAIKWNCTVGGEVYESQMDPIGFLFLVVFGFILLIQLIGMLLHRLFTFLQVLSVGNVSSKEKVKEYTKRVLQDQWAKTVKKEDGGESGQKDKDPTSHPDSTDTPSTPESPQPVDKTKLAVRVDSIIKTRQFAKLWKEKTRERPFSANAVKPLYDGKGEGDGKDGGLDGETERQHEYTPLHWTKVAEQSKHEKSDTEADHTQPELSTVTEEAAPKSKKHKKDKKKKKKKKKERHTDRSPNRTDDIPSSSLQFIDTERTSTPIPENHSNDHGDTNELEGHPSDDLEQQKVDLGDLDAKRASDDNDDSAL